MFTQEKNDHSHGLVDYKLRCMCTSKALVDSIEIELSTLSFLPLLHQRCIRAVPTVSSVEMAQPIHEGWVSLIGLQRSRPVRSGGDRDACDGDDGG